MAAANESAATDISGLAYNFPRANRYSDVLVDASASEAASAIPVVAVSQADLNASLDALDAPHRAWAGSGRFGAKSGELCLLPGPEGGLSRVLLGLGAPSAEPWAFSALAKLPPGTYRLAAGVGADAADRAALGFALGHYSFERYKSKKETKEGQQGGEGGKARLVWPEGANRSSVLALATSYTWCRDLITTPAEDLGPQHLAAEAKALAEAHGAAFTLIQGDELLEQNYPAIHTVGRASCRPPALAMLEWAPPGSEAASLPLLALVGKGVCFDTGGLDLKPAASMKMMKKDMGGAALLLALGHAVMSGGLRCRLLLAVPAVENSVAGNAYRPLDVLQTRAGITVENGNTDAEGRLILCDALAEAASRRPDLLLDAATLTGAARVALGPDVPVVFSTCDDTWRALEAAAREESDPLWRLPLHAPYRKLMDSKVADISSTGPAEGGGGAILAALFMAEFVKDVPRWLHVDTGAYVSGSFTGPGRPEGGEALGLRALWRLLRERYGSS